MSDTETAAGHAIDPLYVEVLGAVHAIHAVSEEQRARLAREWSRSVVTDPGDVDTEPLTLSPGYSDQEAGYALASRLTQAGIRRLRGRYVMLHACGVADDTGQVLALVAGSGSGKTTAARHLARSGLGYVTDETVAVDATGEVLAYPKPLSVVDEAFAGGPKVQHGPDDLGLGKPPASLRLGRIVLIDRGPAHREARIEQVPLLDGLLEVIPQTSSLSRLDRPLQTVCSLIDLSGGLHRLSYTEIDDAADLLEGLLAREVPPPDVPAWEAFTEGVPGADDMSWAILDHRVRLRPHTDAVLVGDEVLIMISDIPIRLRGLGLTIWQACRDAPTVEEIARVVTEVHGSHPDAERIIDETLAELEQMAVIAWGRPRPVSELTPPTVSSLLE
jgi:hypothetical protein